MRYSTPILFNCLNNLNISFFIGFLLVFCPSAYAADVNPASEFRLGYLKELPHFHETYKAKEHLEARFKILSKYFKNPYTLVPTDFQPRSGVSLLNSGEVNAFIGFVKSPQRMYQLRFSKNPVFTTSLNIVAHADKDITYGDFGALNGKSIAMMATNVEAKGQLDAFLTKNNIVMDYKIYDDNMDFTNSSADFKLTSSYYLTDDQRIIMRIGEQGLYFATLPKYEYILNALDSAIEQANKNDALALRDLNNLYIHKDIIVIHQGLSTEEKKLAKKNSKMYRLAYLDNHYPIQYTNEQGQPSGITLSVLKLFHEMHKNPDELIAYNLSTAIDLKQFDMLFSVVGNTALKSEFFHASDVYLNLPMLIFKKTSFDTIKSFGMLDYSTLNHEDVQAIFPRWKINIFNSLDEMIVAYKQNAIDAIFLSEPEAEYVTGKLGMQSNRLIPTTFNLPLKFYLSKKYPAAAVNVLNSYIGRLNPVALKKVILDENRNIHPPITPIEFILKHKIILICIVLLGLSILGLIHFIRVRQTKAKYDKLSQTDALTGLYAKEKAYAIMEQALSKAYPDEYIAVCIDIDKYALLNQVYGSDKANEVLCYLGNFIKDKYVKRVHATCAARLGNDIFLIFGKIKDIGEALDSQEEVLTIIHEIKEILNSNYTISLSRGCYIIDDVTLSVDTIISYCNLARYAGKSEHAVSTTFFDDEMKKTLNAQRDILYKMENGIENNEFILNFQPKVDAKSGNICGAEVLVRWQAPDMPTIYPNDFIPIFEKNAFITKLDIYIFEKTCQFIMENRANLDIPPIAINFSSITLLHVDTLQHINDILTEYQVKPEEIEIEITESAMVVESDMFTNTIQELRNLGFSIAIDDFGAGVSSLHRLSSLNIQTVKLDKAFLDKKFTTKRGVFLVASIINMLRKLGIQVVAEGVETKLQLLILQKINCDVIQGYYFYKPMGMESFVEVLKSFKMKGVEATPPHNSEEKDSAAL